MEKTIKNEYIAYTRGLFLNLLKDKDITELTTDKYVIKAVEVSLKVVSDEIFLINPWTAQITAGFATYNYLFDIGEDTIDIEGFCKTLFKVCNSLFKDEYKDINNLIEIYIDWK